MLYVYLMFQDCVKKVQEALEAGKWVRNITFDSKEVLI